MTVEDDGRAMSEMIVDVGSEPEFAPPPAERPRVRSGAWNWIRHNLFRTKLDAVLTLVFGAIALWVLYKTIRFVFVTGRWEIIEVNLRLLLIGRYPEAHVLRLAVDDRRARRMGRDHRRDRPRPSAPQRAGP